MLMPCRANGDSTSNSAPGWSWMKISSEVRSWPDGGNSSRPEHQEARGVVGAVLDRAGDVLEPVDVAGAVAGDRGRVVGVARAPRGLGVAGDRDLLGLRQVLAQPGLALRERLRVRIDALDVLDAAGARQQVLVHAQLDLAADLQRSRSGTCPASTGSCPAPSSPPAPRRSRRARPRLPGTPPRCWPAAGRATEWPKCLNTACCESVPSGPRKPIFSGSCWARQADMISRNTRTSTSSLSGPSLRSTTRRSTCASRSGR